MAAGSLLFLVILTARLVCKATDLDSVQACANKVESEPCIFRLPPIDDRFAFPAIAPGTVETGKCFTRGVTLFCRSSPGEAMAVACGGKEIGAECVFTAPGTGTWIEVAAFTKETRFANTKGSVFVSFEIDSVWTTPQFFFRGVHLGDTKKQVFSVPGWPSKLALTINSNDAWGYWKIEVNGSVVLEDPGGMKHGERYCSYHPPLYNGTCDTFKVSPYWIEGPPASQFFDISDYGTGDASCSEQEGRVDSSNICIPYSEQACRDAAEAACLRIGGKGWNFTGNYRTKGCYTYSSGKFKGHAYYGLGGSAADRNESLASDATRQRVPGFDCADVPSKSCEAWCSKEITVAAFTSKTRRANTRGCVYVSFLVHGKWAGPPGGYEFFCGAHLGEVKRRNFTVEEWPTKLWVAINSTDVWGFWKITVNGMTVIEDPAGQYSSHNYNPMSSEHSTTTYWLESPARTRTVAIGPRPDDTVSNQPFHVKGRCDISWDRVLFCDEGAYIDRSPALTENQQFHKSGTYYVYLVAAVRNADFAKLKASPKTEEEFIRITGEAIARRLEEDLGRGPASELKFRVNLSEGSIIITAVVALHEKTRKEGVAPKSIMVALRYLGSSLAEDLKKSRTISLIKTGRIDVAVIDMGQVHESDVKAQSPDLHTGCPGRGESQINKYEGQICSRDYGDGHYEKACWLDPCSQSQCEAKCKNAPWCMAYSFTHLSFNKSDLRAGECYLFENCRVLDDHDAYFTVSCSASKQRQHMRFDNGNKAELLADAEEDEDVTKPFHITGSHAGLIVGIVIAVLLCLLCCTAVLIAYICRLRRQLAAERKAMAGWTTITVGRPLDIRQAPFDGVAPGFPVNRNSVGQQEQGNESGKNQKAWQNETNFLS